MGRPKFRITVDNLMHAARYLDGRLGSQALVPRSVSTHEARSFISEILMSPKSDKAAELMQAWCTDNLEPKAMQSMQVAVRKRRQRTRTTDSRVLTVSSRAYELLKKLSQRDRVTLSRALEVAVTSALGRKTLR